MKLGKYKGVHAKRPDTTVSEQDVVMFLNKKQREYCVVRHLDDRPIEFGDEAVLDFEATSNGKVVPAGKASNYALFIGSHKFVSGFEEAIVGHNVGDVFDIAINFPDDYRMAHLRGKDVIFHTTLKQIRVPEYQPMDDEFAKDFSEFDTLAAWKENIHEMLTARKESSAQELLAKELLDTIIADSKIPVDQGLKRDVFEELYEDFLYELEDNGMTFEQYCKRSGLTKAKIRQSKEEEAIRMIKEQSLLHAIANREHLEISDQELSSELCAMAAEEGEDVDDFIDMLGEEEMDSIYDQLLLTKALSLIVENAILD